jgi:hypothetical protein
VRKDDDGLKSIQADAFAFGDVSTTRKSGPEIGTGAYGVQANLCGLVAVAEFNVDGKRQQVEARFGRGGLQAHYACLPHPIQSAAGALGAGEPFVPAHRGSMRSIRRLGSIKNRVSSAPNPERQRRIGCGLSPSYRRIEARCEASGAWAQSRTTWPLGLRLGGLGFCRVRVHASGFGARVRLAERGHRAIGACRTVLKHAAFPAWPRILTLPRFQRHDYSKKARRGYEVKKRDKAKTRYRPH